MALNRTPRCPFFDGVQLLHAKQSFAWFCILRLYRLGVVSVVAFCELIVSLFCLLLNMQLVDSQQSQASASAAPAAKIVHCWYGMPKLNSFGGTIPMSVTCVRVGIVYAKDSIPRRVRLRYSRRDKALPPHDLVRVDRVPHFLPKAKKPCHRL